MKITTVTYRYSAKRIENYQSDEASVELTTQVETGEKPSVVMAAIKVHAKQAVLVEFIKKAQAIPVPAADTNVDQGRWGMVTGQKEAGK